MAYEMPEQPMDDQDDAGWMPRMPQDSFTDLFGDATEASNKGAYTEWSQGLANAQLLNMETPDSFVESAVLQSDDEWHLVEGLIKFGRAQLDSPCNNRIEKAEDAGQGAGAAVGHGEGPRGRQGLRGVAGGPAAGGRVAALPLRRAAGDTGRNQPGDRRGPDPGPDGAIRHAPGVDAPGHGGRVLSGLRRVQGAFQRA